MTLRICFHLLNFVLAQTGRRGDTNALLLARGFVFSHDMQHAVGIDVECHFDLRHTARCGRNSIQMEFAKRSIVVGHRTFTLQHINLHRGLAVGCRAEGFALACGDSCI